MEALDRPVLAQDPSLTSAKTKIPYPCEVSPLGEVSSPVELCPDAGTARTEAGGGARVGPKRLLSHQPEREAAELDLPNRQRRPERELTVYLDRKPGDSL